MEFARDLKIFSVSPNKFRNQYSEKLEFERFEEKINIDNKKLIYQESNNIREHRKLFFDGFVSYKFD